MESPHARDQYPAGLTPDFSDLCVIANADGISYRELILRSVPGSFTVWDGAGASMMARPARVRSSGQDGACGNGQTA